MGSGLPLQAAQVQRVLNADDVGAADHQLIGSYAASAGQLLEHVVRQDALGRLHAVRLLRERHRDGSAGGDAQQDTAHHLQKQR